MFDVGYLRQVPGLKIYCPASFAELRVMLREAVLTDTCPVAVRSPRGGEGAYRANAEATRLKEGTSCTVITYGTMINACLLYTSNIEFLAHLSMQPGEDSYLAPGDLVAQAHAALKG